MEVLDPEIEAFENQLLVSWFEELPLETIKNTSLGRELIEDGIEQGEAKIVTKQAKSRFPGLTQEQEDQIRSLSTPHLEELAVALFNFKDSADLDAWLVSSS